jgi:hypothetical protein
MRQSADETKPRPPHGQRAGMNGITMGRSGRQGSQGPVDASSPRRCRTHLVLDQRLQPGSRRVQAVSTRVARGFRAHPGGPPERDPTSLRAVIVRRRLVVQVSWRRCVGSVDRGRSPRLDRGRRTVGPGARHGVPARRRGRASRSCRMATRGPNCGPSAAQARATADVSSTPRVSPPSRPPDCWRCPPP